jgi:hypothetical protein
MSSCISGAAGACLVASLLAGPSFAATPADDGSGWSLVKLDVDVYPDFKNKLARVHGREELRLDAGSSLGPTLRLGHDLTPLNKHDEFMRFDRLEAGSGADVQMNLPGDKRGIVLASVRYKIARRRGARIALEFDAEEVAPSFEFVVTDKMAFGADGTGWYPRPILAAGLPWSATIESAAGVTRIHLPDGWSSLATGSFAGRAREKDGIVETWRKEAQLPRARAFVAGPYKVAHRTADGKDAWVYSLTSASDPDILVPEVAKIISVLSERFGPYPFAKYAAAEFPDDAVAWWGDAEGDFQVLRTSLLQASNGGVVPLAHEIGHAWWGNTVAPAWPGGYMLTEAMAGYSSMLALEGLYGPERYRQALSTPEPGSPPDYTVANYFKNFAAGKDTALSQLQNNGDDYQISLVKGTFFYHMLRRRVGDDVFFSVLRELVRTHDHKTLSLGELRAAFIAAAPDKGLSQFFAQWLDRTGAPVFAAKLSCARDASGKDATTLVLTQTQPGDAYSFAMDVAFAGGVSAHVESVAVDGPVTIFQPSGAVCYTGVTLDPNYDLFIWRPDYAASAKSD